MSWTCTAVDTPLAWEPKPWYAEQSAYTHWCEFSFKAKPVGGGDERTFVACDVTNEPLTDIPFANRHLIRLVRPGCTLQFMWTLAMPAGMIILPKQLTLVSVSS